MKQWLLLFVGGLFALVSWAQEASLSCQPAMMLQKSDGTSLEVNEVSGDEGNAPLTLRFEARPLRQDSEQVRYEWRFLREGESEPLLLRYEENTTFTFEQSGRYTVQLLATFQHNGSEVSYEQDTPFVISISESKLEWPNAFTPNGDGVNDIFRAKDGHRSLVEFRATIVNRWGKKVAEWTRPEGGWDGRINGSDAPDGAYYLNCEARGADGVRYRVRKTINLLRKYMETSQ